MINNILQAILEYVKAIFQIIQTGWEMITKIYTGITWLYDLISNSMTIVGKYIGWITEQSPYLGMLALANFTLLLMLFLVNRLGDGN